MKMKSETDSDSMAITVLLTRRGRQLGLVDATLRGGDGYFVTVGAPHLQLSPKSKRRRAAILSVFAEAGRLEKATIHHYFFFFFDNRVATEELQKRI